MDSVLVQHQLLPSNADKELVTISKQGDRVSYRRDLTLAYIPLVLLTSLVSNWQLRKVL